MPQFDQFSFFNQVSWFLFLFFNFYFFITYFFLPKICYNLKFRKKKILFDITKKNKINFEKNNICKKSKEKIEKKELENSLSDLELELEDYIVCRIRLYIE